MTIDEDEDESSTGSSSDFDLFDDDMSFDEIDDDNYSMDDERDASFTRGRELSDFYFPKDKTQKRRRSIRKSA